MGSIGANGDHGHQHLSGFYEETDTGYRVTEERLGVPRHIRVVMVGGGASGLNMARHMELHMENYELMIYEKNSDVGGTWFENRYATREPGCAGSLTSQIPRLRLRHSFSQLSIHLGAEPGVVALVRQIRPIPQMDRPCL